ncbi:RNA polymerase factor sigma C [compost metagenome]
MHDFEDDTLLYQIIKLSSKYKEVLLLYYYQDMKIREIAEVLQIPESTVSVRLKAGKGIVKSETKGLVRGCVVITILKISLMLD